MFHIFQNDKLPKEIRRALAPDPAGLKRQKAVFLAAYEQAFGKALLERRSALAMRLTAATLTLFAVTSGMSAYADTANVSATNPLYPLKRLSESARLTFTKQEDRPQFQARLAGRRAKEVDDLRGSKPQSNLLPALAKDLHDDIDDSINEAEKSNLRDRKLVDFCGTLQAAVATTSAAIRDEFLQNPGVLRRLQNKCDSHGADKNKDREDNKNINKDNHNNTNKDTGTSKSSDTEREGGNIDSVSGDSGQDSDLLDLAPAAIQGFSGGVHTNGGRLRLPD